MKVIVERAIVGQEIECAVLGNDNPQASTPCEVLPFKDFYDYEDKYILDKTQFRLPAAVPPDRMEELRRLAVACFQAMGCQGMSRVDFLLESSTGKIFINEINTIPGFTSISMYPKMWDHDGLSYPKLLDRLIELAMERHAARRKLKFTR
jgi:D-alanine-D-alanine ligase